MKRIRQPFTLKTMRDGCRMGGESIPIDICGFECRADVSSSIRFGQTYIPNRIIYLYSKWRAWLRVAYVPESPLLCGP